MSAAWPHRRRTLGVALAADRVTVALDDGHAAARTWERRLPAHAAAEPDAWAAALAPALEEALAEACLAPRAAGPRLHVALLPPLAECRRVELPGLAEEEAQRVLARDAARHFPGVAAACVAGATGLGDGRAFLAAVAPAELVDAVHRAAARVGAAIASIAPAYAAWAHWAAALPARPASNATTRLVLLLLDGRADLLRLDGGDVVALRRLSTVGLAPDGVADAVDAAARAWDAAASWEIAIAGDAALTAPLDAALGGREGRLHPLTSAADGAADPVRLAAIHAPRVRRAPSLLPDGVRAARARGAARRTLATALAAAMLVGAAAALELWGTHREARHLAGQRAALRDSLGGALAVRDTMAGALGRLAALRRAEAESPRWSAAIAAVARHLPREAYVLSLAAEGDSVVLDVAAERAGPVFEALGRAPELPAVRAQGSIRSAASDDDTGPLERFTLVVHITGAAATTAPERGP